MKSVFNWNAISSGNRFLFFRKKRALILLVPVILLFILLIAAIPGAVQREHRYNEAVSLMQSGDYDSAIDLFQTIPSYRDSNMLAEKEIPYLRAKALYDAAESGDISGLNRFGIVLPEENPYESEAIQLYQLASEAFHNLDGYQDSAAFESNCASGIENEKNRLAEEERISKQILYDQALTLLNEGSYSRAADQFRELGSFSDSADMILECSYRKAVSIFQFLCRYDVSKIYAYITVDPEQTSIFSLSSEDALLLGSGCIEDLRLSCGNDLTDIRLEEMPTEQLAPLKDALSSFFNSLENYRDSAEYPDKISAETDYTRDFFMLCSTGDLHAAKNWLDNYHGSFPDRNHWSDLLDLYLPYCENWALYLGDSTLLAYTVNQGFQCMDVASKVILTQDEAILRLSFGDGYSTTFDLPSNVGETLFINTDIDTGIAMAAINNGHFVYMLYDQNWNIISSSDYIRA